MYGVEYITKVIGPVSFMHGNRCWSQPTDALWFPGRLQGGHWEGATRLRCHDSTVTEEDFTSALRSLAVRAVVGQPFAAGLDAAIELATAMIAAGVEDEATLTVACLSKGEPRSVVEPLVLDMLAAHGIAVPSAPDETGRYALLLRAFADGWLPWQDFEGPFYARLLAWEEQSELDQTLVVMLGELDAEVTPHGRESVAEAMRCAVLDSLGICEWS